MKFTGFAVSFALVGAVSAAALPAVPGAAAIDNLEGTLGKVTGAVKRDETDALTGAIYGTTESLNGVTGIAGSVAGTAESTTSGAVGTVEAEVAGIVPGKSPISEPVPHGLHKLTRPNQPSVSSETQKVSLVVLKALLKALSLEPEPQLSAMRPMLLPVPFTVPPNL